MGACVYGVGACVYGNPMILVSAQVPLVLGLGLRVWGLGLTIMPGLGFICACYEGKLRSKGILKVFDMKVDFEDYSSVSSGINFQNISNDRLKILFQLFSSM